MYLIDNPRTSKPTELKVDDLFIDPHREGKRLAKVMKVNGIHTGHDGVDRIHFVLGDYTGFGDWVASYELDIDLERIDHLQAEGF